MPGCCGSGASCSCKISEGTGISVDGSGTPNDPFVISADSHFQGSVGTQFTVNLTGSGTAAAPYVFAVVYSATAKLANIPDVNIASPTNGQVIAWNAASQKWVAAAPTVAPTGAVQHDTSLSGDGSVAQPLAVTTNASRFLSTLIGGVGLNDLGINQLVRHFVDSTARDAASPTPVLNTLSMLDSDPGRITYWDGVQWSPLLASFDWAFAGTTSEFLALSGSYLGSRTTHLIKQVSATTDASGIMDVLTPADLAGRAGVLSCMFQETGPVGIAYKAILFANSDRVSAYVYRLSDGSPYISFSFTGMVDAWVY